MFKLENVGYLISNNLLILKTIVIGSVLASILSYGYFWHKSEVKIEVNKAEMALIEKYKKQNNLLEQKANKATVTLKQNQDKIVKEKDAKIKQLDTDINTLIVSLLNRPDRPKISSNYTRNPFNPEDTAKGTGAGLYKPDAEFLAGYASNTERLKIELIACYKQYDEVKTNIDTFRKENTK